MNKALVEQAGGDERAEFERAFTVQEGVYFDDKRGEYRSMNLRAIEATDAQDLNLRLQGWQARAALAQPSPVPELERSATFSVPSCENSYGFGYVDGTCIQSLRGYRDHLETIVDALPEGELMTVAQHERIVKAWIERWKAYIELSAKIAAQRDAALARVAELERELRDEENAHTTTIEQRDNAEHWADQLAKAIAERFGVDIGEHSNLNCPWNEALVWMQQPPTQAQHSVPDHAELLQALERTHAGHMVGHDQSDQPKGGYSDGYVNGFGECIKVARKVLAAAPGKEVPQAWLDVQAERRRQITAEGWTPEHDDGHACDEIAAFACYYAMPPAVREWDASSTGYGDTLGEAVLPEGWEPKTGDRRRDLIKACALALAEIERLDRAAPGKEGV
ncbi:TPA: hypothetical protein ACGBGH_004792 [Pseudomonas aeruginosa]